MIIPVEKASPSEARQHALDGSDVVSESDLTDDDGPESLEPPPPMYDTIIGAGTMIRASLFDYVR